MPEMPTVSILILAHNKVRFTTRCLDSLLQTSYPNAELWLVDNGSTDDTPVLFDRVQIQAERRNGWTVRRIDFEKNVGAVQGRNAALEQVTGEYIVFLDNDVVVGSPDWLADMVHRMQQDSELGVLGPKLVFPKPENTIQCAGCVVTPAGRVDFRGRGKDARALEFNIEREVQCLISACWILRRAVVDEVGLLDMAYHPVQFEDIDYCYRLRQAGWKALYYPEVTMYHYENVTTDGTGSLNYRYLTIKNGLTFKKNWRHMFRDEGGPPDDSIEWVEIPRVELDEIDEPEGPLGVRSPLPSGSADGPASLPESQTAAEASDTREEGSEGDVLARTPIPSPVPEVSANETVAAPEESAKPDNAGPIDPPAFAPFRSVAPEAESAPAPEPEPPEAPEEAEEIPAVESPTPPPAPVEEALSDTAIPAAEARSPLDDLEDLEDLQDAGEEEPPQPVEDLPEAPPVEAIDDLEEAESDTLPDEAPAGDPAPDDLDEIQSDQLPAPDLADTRAAEGAEELDPAEETHSNQTGPLLGTAARLVAVALAIAAAAWVLHSLDARRAPDTQVPAENDEKPDRSPPDPPPGDGQRTTPTTAETSAPDADGPTVGAIAQANGPGTSSTRPQPEGQPRQPSDPERASAGGEAPAPSRGPAGPDEEPDQPDAPGATASGRTPGGPETTQPDNRAGSQTPDQAQPQQPQPDEQPGPTQPAQRPDEPEEPDQPQHPVMEANETPWKERAITGFLPRPNLVLYRKSRILLLRNHDDIVRVVRNIQIQGGQILPGRYRIEARAYRTRGSAQAQAPRAQGLDAHDTADEAQRFILVRTAKRSAATVEIAPHAILPAAAWREVYRAVPRGTIILVVDR